MAEAPRAAAPAMPEPVLAIMPCEDCGGTGHTGEVWPGTEFQPPEAEACSSCGGSGRWKDVPMLTLDQVRERDAEWLGRADEALGTLQCADNVFGLLQPEVDRLGCKAGNVRQRIKAAIAALSSPAASPGSNEA